MDEFGLEVQELTGNLISMSFGPGGRINQVWITDPGVPDGAEFQVVCGPIAFGEEVIDDYFPGTILLGARTAPEEPWIVSRNSQATLTSDPDDLSTIEYEYEFGLLHELHVTGKFVEVLGPLPQIHWDITIKNKSRQSVEIGELGFPFAFATVLDGYDRTEQGMQELMDERVHIHKFIGGSASYLAVQRMNARAPGMVIFPGENTQWEFYHHAAASINTPFRWEGIPVVYVHSKATIEREGWPEWFNGHTSTIMEPGEEKLIQIRFSPLDRDRPDHVAVPLASSRRPTIKVLPAAVAPRDVGIAVEITGCTPTQFTTDVPCETESDSDEDGGFCFVRPAESGAVKLMFDDTEGRASYCHLLFTEPLQELICNRAKWIAENQVAGPDGLLPYAILPADNRSGESITELEIFQTPFGIESSLGEAIFLAEKNRIYPDLGQIVVLDDFIDHFFHVRFQNPGNCEIGMVITDANSTATNTGRAQVYALAIALYQSMGHLSEFSPTRRSGREYFEMAADTLGALFRFANPNTFDGVGLPFASDWKDVANQLRVHGREDLAEQVDELIEARIETLNRRKYPFFRGNGFSSASFEEAAFAAEVEGDFESVERITRYATIARSQAPSWWCYGSERRSFDEGEMVGHPVALDRGEMSLGSSAVANALIFFRSLSRDYVQLPEMVLRSAFGAMLGIWALVRADGAAAMGFCADEASKQYGIAWSTGDVGVGLATYLRHVGSYVLPVPGIGVSTFGCHFEVVQVDGRETLHVRPWEGVGRKIVIRHLGIEIQAFGFQIESLEIDTTKRRAVVTLSNRAGTAVMGRLVCSGIWGKRVDIDGKIVETQDGELVADLLVQPGASRSVELNTI